MRSKLLLVLILILATALRLYHVAAISLWHDEAFSALLIKYPWHEMFYRIGLDVHPPIYYVLLRFWYYVFGWSVFALRGFSVFFGVGMVLAGYLFVKEAFGNEKAALFCALILAINPFQTQYVTEARMYTLGTFLALISAYFLVKAFKAQRQYFAEKTAGAISHKAIDAVWGNWFLFALATSLSIYTHYYLFFTAAGIGLYGLFYLYKNFKFKWEQWRYFIAAYVLVLLSYVPWLKTFIFQFKQVQASYWIPKMNIWSIPLTLYELLTGAQADANKTAVKIVLALATIFTIYFLYRFAKTEKHFEKWLVILGVLAPFAGAVLLSLKQSIFLDRYFIFASLFYTIALVIFLLNIKRKAVGYALLAALIAVNLYNFRKNWQNLDVSQRPGMSAAAQFLNDNAQGGQKIDVASSFEFFNFKYYNHTGIKPQLYTDGLSIQNLPHFSGTALMSADDILKNFSENASPGNIVWVIWTNGFGGTAPAVPLNWQEKSHHSWPDVRPYLGTNIVVDKYLVK